MAISVIKTIGGKFYCKEKIINYFPKHTIYIELFSGAAHILFQKDRSTVEVLNDIDKDIYSFFKVLRDNPDELMFKIMTTPYSRAQFRELKEMQPINELERAWRFFCLNRMAFGGKRGGTVSFGYGIQRMPALVKIEKFMPLIERLNSVYIENLDFGELLERYSGHPNPKDVLVYADPPYYETEHHYDSFDFSKDDHERLADIFKASEYNFLISYGDHPFIRELYSGYNLIEIDRYDTIIKTRGNDSRKAVKDLLIANYDLGAFSHPLFHCVEGDSYGKV